MAYIPASVLAIVYEPGETLEPDCTPTADECTVATSAGSISINGESAQAFTFSAGTTGLDFAIAVSSDALTFNLPTASSTARGLVSTGTQTFAGDKTFTGCNDASGYHSFCPYYWK
ncbi:MAG: hypothetical protein WDN67_02755 [Candidatus Moraniibacteriota bacterium]